MAHIPWSLSQSTFNQMNGIASYNDLVYNVLLVWTKNYVMV